MQAVELIARRLKSRSVLLGMIASSIAIALWMQRYQKKIDQMTFASTTKRSREETTTPPGFSTVTANIVAFVTRILGSILTITSPVSASTSNTPPSTG